MESLSKRQEEAFLFFGEIVRESDEFLCLRYGKAGLNDKGERKFLIKDVQNKFFSATELKEAAAFAVKKSDQGNDVFAGIAARKLGGTKKDGIIRCHLFYADVDAPGASSRLEELPPPSFSNTSGGLCDDGTEKTHAYWVLEEAVSTADLERVTKPLSQFLAQGVEHVFDASHILRVPGTWYFKHADTKDRLTKTLHHTDATYGYDEIIAPDPIAAPANLRRDYGETYGEGEDRGNYLCAVGGTLKRLYLDSDYAYGYLLAHNEVFCDPPAAESHVRNAHAYLIQDRRNGDTMDYGEGTDTLLAIMRHLRSDAYDEKAREVIAAFNDMLVPRQSDEDLDLLYEAHIAADEEDSKTEKKKSKSQALRLVESVEADLFHTPDRRGYAAMMVNGHQETFEIMSDDFGRWVAHEFTEREGTIPSSQAVKDAQGRLLQIALYKGDKREVYLRHAEHGGNIYLDLADADRTVIEITRDGWGAVTDPPVSFRRPHSTLPIPMPVRGGNVEELRPLLNVASDEDWTMALSVIIYALKPNGPRVIEIDMGGEGSVKTTAGRIVGGLTDPTESADRSLPRSLRDLAVATRGARTLIFDNLSHLDEEHSDALCRLTTGASQSYRRLYSNDEEIIFKERCTVILNSITEAATRPDLLNRAVLIQHPEVPEEKRLSEEKALALFEEVRPRLLGALLDVVATGLRNLPTTEVARLPRQADFALWMVACSPALGWDETKFLDTYEENRASAIASILDHYTVARHIMTLARRGFYGHATDLLDEIRMLDYTGKHEGFPRNASAMGKSLARLTNSLKQSGVEVEMEKSGKRFVRIWMAGNPRPTEPATKQTTAEKLEEAVGFLRLALAEGPVLASEVSEVAEERGISESTLKRARRALGIPSKPQGFRGPHYLALPHQEIPDPDEPDEYDEQEPMSEPGNGNGHLSDEEKEELIMSGTVSSNPTSTLTGREKFRALK
jgi:hypothetical protein